VNHPTLYKIEAGQRANPSIAIIVRIAQALGTTAETLLGFERDEMRLAVEANDPVRPCATSRKPAKPVPHDPSRQRRGSRPAASH
jgi:transcriptional regulator with XRE-family HTH domain